MTSCPFEDQSGKSSRPRPRATRLVRTVHGRDANSRPSPEIGNGDPSKCCTGVQTSSTGLGLTICRGLIDLHRG